ncbi:hypothetical protein CsSME_00012386 [Camellia sinensis var. sinensis]
MLLFSSRPPSDRGSRLEQSYIPNRLRFLRLLASGKDLRLPQSRMQIVSRDGQSILIPSSAKSDSTFLHHLIASCFSVDGSPPLDNKYVSDAQLSTLNSCRLLSVINSGRDSKASHLTTRSSLSIDGKPFIGKEMRLAQLTIISTPRDVYVCRSCGSFFSIPQSSIVKYSSLVMQGSPSCCCFFEPSPPFSCSSSNKQTSLGQ